MIRLIIAMILSVTCLNAQGFDWQYSYRGPSNSPRLFFGASLQTDYSLYSGDINFSEDMITCCRFNSGNGNSNTAGIVSEYWLKGGEIAISAGLGYKSLHSSFTAYPDPVFYLTDTLFSEIEFSNQISYLSFVLSAKYRIELSHFCAGMGLRFDVLMNSSFEHKEKITSEGDSFNDGTVSRPINSGRINELSGILVIPEIKFSYDLNLGLGMYAVPNFVISFNTNEIAKQTSWKSVSFSLGVQIFKGMN